MAQGTFVTLATLLVTGTPGVAAAQQSMSDVLGFLLTNRSIVTDDFARDEQAAAATRETMTRFLLAELSTLPIASPASGFTYRLEPAIGADVRSSASFGPFFLQRSLTLGEGQTSFTLALQRASFATIDGRPLRDGTLIATASRLRGDAQPFDTETISLDLDTATMTASGTFGVTDRFDITLAVPFVTLRMNGERVDTYRGARSSQATARASASGLGDVFVGGKYNVWRHGGSGVAIGADARLPTGDDENLLGSGKLSIAPRAIGSFDYGRVAVHGDLAYVTGGWSDAFEYGGAISIAASPRVTVGAEVLGRWMDSGGRLVESIQAHPHLSDVETIRLVGTAEPTTRYAVVAGVRWNVAARWLVNASVLRSMTSTGLQARWMPTLSLDYSFGW
jgi:hypothetical protein